MAEEAKTARDAKKQPNQLARGRYRFDVPDSPFLEQVQEWILKHNLKHLYSPEKIDYEMDELVVLVLLRNGRPYIKPFIEHYFSLGAKHIVFLDNGSTDGTVEALQNYDNVTVLRTGLPYKRQYMRFVEREEQRNGHYSEESRSESAEGPTASPPPGTAARGHPGLPDLEADEGATPHQGQGIESGKEFVLTWLENLQKR